jgi:hypothetical protein
MLWEGKSLRDLRAADVRLLVESGLAEHLQLEYKGALYDANERARKEFLLDICMFANEAGGILLIGVPERRDADGQPTGTPDPDGVLGLELPNPEAVLASYDARVMEAVEERLSLESAPVDVGAGRKVLALRVPNSVRKPHSVKHEGHIYFPSRRERQRYYLSVREIKELAVRTASRLEQAKEHLQDAFFNVVRQPRLPYLVIGMAPVFLDDFLVDVRAHTVQRAVAEFSRTQRAQYQEPRYTFDGLERREQQSDYVVALRRNGLLTMSQQLPLQPPQPGDAGNQPAFFMTAADLLLRRFVPKASAVYEAATVGAPYLLGMMMRIQEPLVGAYAAEDLPAGHYRTPPVAGGDYRFPFTQIDDISSVDKIIRPLCDQAHQMFGREGSPSFNEQGAWIAQLPRRS